MKKQILVLSILLSYTLCAQTYKDHFKAGVSQLKANNYSAAQIEFTAAIDLNPNSSSSYYNRAVAKSRMTDYKGAIQDYDKALELNPKNAWAYKNGDLARRNLARYKSPYELFTTSTDAQSNAKSALIKTKIGDYDGAVKDYTAAIYLHPTAGFYFGRGEALYNLKNYSLAVEDFTEAIKLDDKYAKAYLNRGSAQYSMGNKMKACADWQQASNLGISQANDALNKFCK